jgi:hypothetical protein
MAGNVVRSEALARASAIPDLIRGGYFSPAMCAGPFVYLLPRRR